MVPVIGDYAPAMPERADVGGPPRISLPRQTSARAVGESDGFSDRDQFDQHLVDVVAPGRGWADLVARVHQAQSLCLQCS